MTDSIKKVLTIAGSDSSGGAGVQADLKTFGANACYGMSVITALTAQNTLGVQGVYPVDADFLALQLQSVLDDVPPDAIKIGMVGDVASIEVLGQVLKEYDVRNIVLDPVMVATSGDQLISDDAVAALKAHLIPLADVITPNLQEAKILGSEDASALLALGAGAVLVKGGHSDDAMAIDVLAMVDDVQAFEAPRLVTKNTHGTGCTLSAAIACGLAKGLDLPSAVGEAKTYITEAIRHADGLNVGAGAGPVHHFWKGH